MLSISNNSNKTQVVLSFVKHSLQPYGTQTLSYPLNALGVDTDTNLIRFYTVGNNADVCYAYVDDIVINGTPATMDNIQNLFAEVACGATSGGGGGEGCDCEDVIAGVEDEISGLTEGVASIQSEVSSISGDVSTISGNVSTLSGSVSTLSSNISSVSGNVNTISGNVSTISGNVSTISGNVETLSGSVSTLSSSIPTKVSDLNNDAGYLTSSDFKTINNESIVGSGNIDIQGGGVTIERVTQAAYDALPSSAKTDDSIIYVITDADSEYYTKTEVDDLISGATSDIETLSGDVISLSSSVQSVSGNVNTLSGNVNTLSGNVSTLSGNVSTISGDVASISGDVHTMSDSLGNLSGLEGLSFYYDDSTHTLEFYYTDPNETP